MDKFKLYLSILVSVLEAAVFATILFFVLKLLTVVHWLPIKIF